MICTTELDREAYYVYFVLLIAVFMRKTTFFIILFLFFQAVKAQTVNFTSSNLPIIVINTNGQTIVDEPKVSADMGIIFNAGGARNNLSDIPNHYNGKVGIEIRGQSSQMFPMKSYTIELWDAAGAAQDKSLFGLPKESDWVLYAPFTDKTLMRNFLAYTMSREMGHWAANCRFVELMLNGDYKGVYVFMEKIKRGSGRVPIAKMANTDISGDALTGGYIFSLDKEPNGWFSSYVAPNSTNNNKRQFSYVYPKPENIVSEQQNYLKNYVDDFENALAGPNFQDPVNGVRKYANIGSFIDYFIVNEVSRNVDGYRLSSYFHKDRDSKDGHIFAGPVWDYDLSFRNANYCNGSDLSGWAYQFNLSCPGDGAGLIPFWWNRFMQDTAFAGNLYCRWKDLRKTNLSQEHMEHLVDSVVNLLSEAQVRHFTRWPILGQYVWPNPEPIAKSYSEEIAYLKAWMAARMNWIDKNLPNTGACYDIPVSNADLTISIAPNPITSNGIVTIVSRNVQVLKFQIVDMLGHQLRSGTISLNIGLNRMPLDATNWAHGLYAIQFTTGRGDKITRRIVR